MAGTIVVDTIQSDSSYTSTINVASKVNFTGGMQVGGQDSTFGGMRNRVINGAMLIDQRNVGASVSRSCAAYSTQVDRFYGGGLNGSGTFTIQQVSDAPTGFQKSVKFTTATAEASPGATVECGLQQNIEGNNIIDLNWGTSSAKSCTLSFWVKSSLTGNFGVGIRNAGTWNRTFISQYTINQANTWEYKTIVVTGPTDGTWNTTFGSPGINIAFDLGSGSNFAGTANTWNASAGFKVSGNVSFVSNLNATWQVTGVQFEKGSVATDYEYRLFTTELQLCQRYFEKSFPLSTAPANATGLAGCITAEQWATNHNYLRFGVVEFATEKAVNPTITFYNPITASTTPSGLRAGSEDSTSTKNNSIGDRTNFRSTRCFFPLLDGTNQGGQAQFWVWCSQWTAEAEI